MVTFATYVLTIFAIVRIGISAEDCFEYNVDYEATNMNNGLEQRTNSASDCWNLCKLTLGCEGFTWASSNFPGTLFM